MFAVLHVPCFHLQAALRPRNEDARTPLALVDGAEKKSVVMEANAPARRAGVSAGLASAQAQSRCPDLKFIPRDPAQEEAAQAALLDVAGALSPEIESTAPGLCTLQLRLPAEHDWRRTGHQAVALCRPQGLLARVGLAPNPDLALLAARRANPVLVVLEPAAFLDSLSLRALSPPAELTGILRDWGIRTLGQLRALPRAEMVDRLGPEAGRWWELAGGMAMRPLRLISPPVTFVESFDFEQAIETLEPLLFILRRLLDLLAHRLRCGWRVAGEMLLTLPLENGTAHERRFTIPAPTADPDTLFRILHTHLESLRLEQRPAGVRLRMEPVRKSHDQMQLFETALRDPNRLGETLARLAALTGPEHTGVIRRQDTHRPDTWEITEPQFHRPAGAAPATPPRLTGLPLRRLRPAPAATVQMAGHTPSHVECSLVRGDVRDALGPYRLSGRWWEKNIAWAREEWDVELDNGCLLRLARETSGWRLEGYYDWPAPEVDAAKRGPVIEFPAALVTREKV